MTARAIRFCALFLLFLLPCGTAFSQTDKKFFKGRFRNTEQRIALTLDLYETTLEAPGLGFLGLLSGYMDGRGIYGVWMITQHDITGNTATLRLSNDMGSDAQTIELKQLSDSTVSYRAVGGNNIRRAEGRKLVKIVPEMILVKEK